MENKVSSRQSYDIAVSSVRQKRSAQVLNSQFQSCEQSSIKLRMTRRQFVYGAFSFLTLSAQSPSSGAIVTVSHAGLVGGRGEALLVPIAAKQNFFLKHGIATLTGVARLRRFMRSTELHCNAGVRSTGVHPETALRPRKETVDVPDRIRSRWDRDRQRRDGAVRVRWKGGKTDSRPHRMPECAWL
jgi:hypothetical protein